MLRAHLLSRKTNLDISTPHILFSRGKFSLKSLTILECSRFTASCFPHKKVGKSQHVIRQIRSKSSLDESPGLESNKLHVPVLLKEVLEAFRNIQVKVYVDCTLGAGGHAHALAAEHKELELLVGIDQDPGALETASRTLAGLPASGVETRLVRSNFSGLKQVLRATAADTPFAGVDAMLIDLGMSSMQVDTAERGFSFLKDGPLDMRMDPDGALTAEEVVNTWSERSLGELFRDYGEERFWRQYASRLCVAREREPLTTTRQLAEAIGFPPGKRPRHKQVHPATRVFQALRIAVNDELSVAERVIPDAIEALSPGGRLAVITFHSLEDRIVKRAFMQAAGRAAPDLAAPGARLRLQMEPPPALVQLVNRKPITAAEAELASNPRSRSAKLRVIEKI
uniref:16S rRNA (Cytosine1402-N4)-methyltransferase n=1 Tax=Tetraselmis sp. GSL018 TaxID=582737 RepID=A0A061QRS8_9CHLO